ncbi:DMT family transporter [Gordonia soli]|nr:DMT family transporter [Gordonia soli]
MSRVGWQYAGVSVAWGASYLFMRIATYGLGAGHIVVGRLVLGALVLAGCMRVLSKPWPREGRYWMHVLVIALSACVVPHLLLAWASAQMPSVLVSVCTSVTPLLTVLVTVTGFRQEPVTATTIAAVALGAIGIVGVLAPWQTTADATIAGYGACLGASACYAVSFAYTRRFVTPRGYDSVTTATCQITLAALIAVMAAPWTASSSIDLTPAIIAAMLCLGVVGTGLSYIWYQAVITAWGAPTASTITYLMPAIGVALGTLVLGEHLTWTQLGAMMLVLTSVVLDRAAARRHRPPPHQPD